VQTFLAKLWQEQATFEMMMMMMTTMMPAALELY